MNIVAPKVGWRRPAEIRKDLLKSRAIPSEWFEKSDLYGWRISLGILLPFFASLGAAPFLWLYVSPLAVLPLALIIGIYGYKISFIMHDCSHDTLFRSPGLNRALGDFCGWVVVANYPLFKSSHALHHRHNGTDGDPQFGEAGGFQGASSGAIIWHLTNALVGQRLFGYLLGYLTKNRMGSQGTPDSAPRITVSWLLATACCQLCILVLVTGLGRVPILACLYPAAAATISLCLARLRTFAEHVLPPEGDFKDFTRSHLPNWLDAFFLYDAHFNYHLEHHLFPHMPSRHLPAFFEMNRDFVHARQTLNPSMFGTIGNRIRASA